MTTVTISTNTILSAPCGTVLDTGAVGPMVVSHRENIRDGVAELVTLTQDGRHHDRSGWHTGPEAEWVFVERWSFFGREFHGWIDQVSRKMTQSG